MRALAIACATLALAPAFAQAHTGIKSKSPRAGSTVPRSLAAVSVRFEASVAGGSLKVRKKGGGKVSVGNGGLTSGGKVLRVSLRSGLTAGRYKATVEWVSSDGHADKKSWRFRVS